MLLAGRSPRFHPQMLSKDVHSAVSNLHQKTTSAPEEGMVMSVNSPSKFLMISPLSTPSCHEKTVVAYEMSRACLVFMKVINMTRLCTNRTLIIIATNVEL